MTDMHVIVILIVLFSLWFIGSCSEGYIKGIYSGWTWRKKP